MQALHRRIARRARRLPDRAGESIARRRGLRALRERTDEPSRVLARVLDAAAAREASPEERAWFERIERRRADLLASQDELEAYASEFSGDPDDREVSVRGLAELCEVSSKPRFWAELLFRVVREARPAAVLELGTCVGISAAYQAAALELNGAGRLLTLDAAASRLAVAQAGFDELGLARVETRHGRFEDTLGPALEELGEVALAFVDGHHDEGATIAYWERIAPRLARPALVVFDDIRWSDGMTRAWRAIAADARVELALDLRALGVCVVGAGGEAQEIEVPLDDR
jgi:predicted O-methyltransferase YrrM